MISLAFSPCPNDTYIFDALVHRKIDTEGLDFSFRMADVETLNQLALRGEADMIKVSFHTYLYLLKQYALLQSGSALGSGNGPLLIAGEPFSEEKIKDLYVAIPGEFTTAHLLFRLAFPEARLKRYMVFSEIEDAVLERRADAGVIIHENRFTYESRGLVKIKDLGEFWENLTGMPVPLGGIVVRKSLGYDTYHKLNRIMHRSVEYAMKHPSDVMPFVKENAQEMDETVQKKHIGLYVNDFTLELGETGNSAVATLLNAAIEKKLIP